MNQILNPDLIPNRFIFGPQLPAIYDSLPPALAVHGLFVCLFFSFYLSHFPLSIQA